MAMGLQEVEVYVKGPGPGRENAIRAVQATGFEGDGNYRSDSGTA